MKRLVFLVMACLFVIPSLAFAETGGKKEKLPPMSKETNTCIGCHKFYTPGAAGK